MPVTKDETLNKLIAQFEELQERYKEYGAQDTEPDGHFQWVISRALEGKPINWSALDWELYDKPGVAAVALAMTRVAQRVYGHIEVHGKLADLQALQDYCWRIF